MRQVMPVRYGWLLTFFGYGTLKRGWKEFLLAMVYMSIVVLVLHFGGAGDTLDDLAKTTAVRIGTTALVFVIGLDIKMTYSLYRDRVRGYYELTDEILYSANTVMSLLKPRSGDEVAWIAYELISVLKALLYASPHVFRGPPRRVWSNPISMGTVKNELIPIWSKSTTYKEGTPPRTLVASALIIPHTFKGRFEGRGDLDLINALIERAKGLAMSLHRVGEGGVELRVAVSMMQTTMAIQRKVSHLRSGIDVPAPPVYIQTIQIAVLLSVVALGLILWAEIRLYTLLIYPIVVFLVVGIYFASDSMRTPFVDRTYNRSVDIDLYDTVHSIALRIDTVYDYFYLNADRDARLR
jgi:hypothetical protein